MERAQVLDWSLQEQLRPYMSCLKPKPSIYIPEFIAANQESRADNVLTGTMAEQVIKVSDSPFYSSVYFFSLAICLKEYMIFQMERIRADIRDFRQASGVDKVIVLWTANTERFCDIIPGVNDSAKNLLAAIQVRSMAIKINPESSLSANHNNEPT